MRWPGARSRIALVCILGATATRGVGGQTPDIRVQRVGAERVVADPGRRVTLTFRVSNRSSAERVLATRADLPLGWQVLIPDSTVTLPAGESELLLIPVILPRSARAGTYVVRYLATRSVGVPTGPSVADSVLVAVAERRQMSARVARAPRFVGAGDSYTAVFVVENTGNAPATAQLELTGTRGINARADATSVQLEAGQEKNITVAVATSAKETQKRIQLIGLRARIGNDTALASATTSVEIIPRRAADASTRPTLPVLLGLGQSDGSGRITPELRGNGAIGPDQSSQVAFVFRPRAPGDYILSQDEYWMSIASQGRYALQLGDASYANSHLLQQFRPNAGVRGRVEVGSLIFEAQALQDRRTYFFSHERQYGGSVDLRLFGDQTRVGVAALRRSGVNEGTIIQARGFSRLPGLGLFDWEYGPGSGPLGGGNGYFTSLGGSAGRLTYTMQRESYAAEFPGVASGTTYSFADFRLPLVRHLGLLANGSENTRKRFGLLPSSADVLHRSLEAGVSISQFLGLTYRQTRDTGLTSSAPRSGKMARAFLTLPLPVVRLTGHIERGYSVLDNAPGIEIPSRRIGGNGTIRFWRQSLGASFDRLTGKSPTGAFDLDETISQVTASVRVTQASSLNASYSTSRSGGPFGRVFSTVQVGLNQRLPMGHEVSWQAQSLSSQPGFGDRETRYRTQYVMPLSVPVGGEQTGSLDVALIDEATHRPISGALVRFGGDARLTDALGHARFTGAVEGPTYLDVDHSYLGPDRIVAPGLPLTVDIVRGERRAVELRVSGAAQILGTMQLLEFGPNRPLGAPDTLIDAGGQSHMHLQLSCTTDTLRTVSNGGGRFRFGDLHPGHWVLTVDPVGMPDLHRAEQERFEFDLRPGDSREIAIRLLPVRPKVNFIVEAELKPTVTVGAAGAPPRVSKPAIPSWWPRADSTWSAPTVLHTYTVGPKDVGLMMIARWMYDDASLWPKIWMANLDQVPDPGVIHAGDVLRIPEKAPLTAAEIAARDAYQRKRP